MSRFAWTRLLAIFLGVFATAIGIARPAVAADPTQGPGGPILVVTAPSATFGRYYAEILRNEGLNAFAVAADISAVTPTALAAYDVVILGRMPLTTSQVTMLTDWVNSGGNLIAMEPHPMLAGLLGITPTGATLTNGYVLVDGTTPVGGGIANQTMQFHGTAQRNTLNGASSLATLYSNATTPTSNPAVTLRSVGIKRWSGGRVRLRSRHIHRLHPAGQSGLGGPGARRLRPDPLGRQVLRRRRR